MLTGGATFLARGYKWNLTVLATERPGFFATYETLTFIREEVAGRERAVRLTLVIEMCHPLRQKPRLRGLPTC